MYWDDEYGTHKYPAVPLPVLLHPDQDVLIFDEPTSGLDYDSMIQVAGLFQTLSKMGKVIFVVTHDYEFLAAACTRVIHLDNGKQQEDYPLSPDNLHRLHDFFLRSERRQNLEENGK